MDSGDLTPKPCHSQAEDQESAVASSVEAVGKKKIPQRLNAVSE